MVCGDIDGALDGMVCGDIDGALDGMVCVFDGTYTIRSHKVRAISARDMHKKERNFYEKEA